MDEINVTVIKDTPEVNLSAGISSPPSSINVTVEALTPGTDNGAVDQLRSELGNFSADLTLNYQIAKL